MSGKTIVSTSMKYEIIKHNIRATRDFGASSSTYTWTVTNKYGGNLTSDYLVTVYGRVVAPFTGIEGPVYVEIADSDKTYTMLSKVNLKEARADGILFTHCPVLDDLSRKCQQYPGHSFAYASPVVTFTSESGNLSDLTAGEIEIILVTLVGE